MESFDKLLEESVAKHGHLCAGQVIGVRMAMLGLKLVGIDAPNAPDMQKKLIVFVEIDRCATDAIETVTGCRLGKRSLKFKDFGINAATFLNLETKQAYRIVSTESSREKAAEYAPNEPTLQRRQIEGYKIMPDEILFDVQRVTVDLSEADMPGPPRSQAVCTQCGQVVRDGKEKRNGCGVLCSHCAGVGYFKPYMR